MIHELAFEKLQFYWRQTQKPNDPPNVVPDFLPFSFFFDERFSLLRQTPNELVLESLHKIYLEDFNVGYLDAENSLAKQYGEDFLNFVGEHIPSRASSVIEVGCGKGYLLKILKGKGHSVAGIDPSPAASGLADDGIPVIKSFFPVSGLSEKWDVVLHYDVLEHIQDLESFFSGIRKILTADGITIFAVPDCTEAIQRGDISMILHEHINYFDTGSLTSTVRACGFEVLQIMRSSKVGTIYCVARPMEGVSTANGALEFEVFKAKANRNLEAFRSAYTAAIEAGKSVGFFVPLRFLPYHSQCDVRPGADVRFFDDGSAFRDRYFDGYDIRIEPGSNLFERPVDVLFIGSYVFGEALRSKFSGTIPGGILTISDLFGRSQGTL